MMRSTPSCFEAVNIGAEIQFAGQKFVAARMAREKRHFAACESAENVGIGGIAKWRLQLRLRARPETRHVVQTAAADNSNFCLLQLRS